jgi:hypothetical protein
MPTTILGIPSYPIFAYGLDYTMLLSTLKFWEMEEKDRGKDPRHYGSYQERK